MSTPPSSAASGARTAAAPSPDVAASNGEDAASASPEQPFGQRELPASVGSFEALLEEVLQAQAAASKTGEGADALAPADQSGAAGESVSLALRGQNKGDG
jgi:hypothetical protein